MHTGSTLAQLKDDWQPRGLARVKGLMRTLQSLGMHVDCAVAHAKARGLEPPCSRKYAKRKRIENVSSSRTRACQCAAKELVSRLVGLSLGKGKSGE